MEVLHSSHCHIPHLALTTDLLYWTQHNCSSEGLRSLDLVTLKETAISSGPSNGVAVHKDTIYWTGTTRVRSAPVVGVSTVSELLYISNYGTALFRGIKVVHPDLQQRYTQEQLKVLCILNYFTDT